MKSILLIVATLILFSKSNAIGDSQKVKIKIAHFNIKELDTTKLQANTIQIQAAQEILKELNADIISINEIQYDLPTVPTPQNTTTGQNLSLLGKPNFPHHNSIFFPANTGLKAKRLPNGNFTTDSGHPDWKNLADHDNFGLFPAQYSTGALSRYPVLSAKSISTLKWRDFDPTFDPSLYKDALGAPYNRDLELFDKNFTDAVLDINGKKVHLILLHTVPAFYFGNPHGLNEKRNAAQLRFLKYYLTGELTGSDQAVSAPLEKGSSFIAMGDWNVDRDQSPLEGAQTLKSLGERFQYWIKDRVVTYESQNFSNNPFASQLDYILFSKDFELKRGEVYRADQRIEKGCDQRPTEPIPNDYSLERYQNNNGKTCWVYVPIKMAKAKRASDHFALYAELELK